MTEPAERVWRISARSSADALEEAKHLAHEEGFRVVGVRRVDFVAATVWDVRLSVRPKEPPR